MFESIKKFLGLGPTPNYKDLLANGAVIIDVRTKAEFSSGHIKNSVNIPLDSVKQVTSKFKDKNQTIITCCASGMRSASAKSILKSSGYANVYNGGGWMSLNSKL